jgi:HAD superfamily phosphoserine phosphatase-like hydrolase
MTSVATLPSKRYLLASDFDQTLSRADSGRILSELIGISPAVFEHKCAGLAARNFVQQGGELAYLLLHDPAYRRVRREHLIEAGLRTPLKRNIGHLARLLAEGIPGHEFEFQVISASPQEVVEAALAQVLPAERIHGTRLEYGPDGAVAGLARVTAGYGKVAVLDALQAGARLGAERIVYVGDGSSDMHVMLHVRRHSGYAIAVSSHRPVARIAHRTVLGEDSLAVLVPLLEDIVGWNAADVRAFFAAQGLHIQEWGSVRTDWLTIAPAGPGPADHAPVATLIANPGAAPVGPAADAAIEIPHALVS